MRVCMVGGGGGGGGCPRLRVRVGVCMRYLNDYSHV